MTLSEEITLAGYLPELEIRSAEQAKTAAAALKSAGIKLVRISDADSAETLDILEKEGISFAQESYDLAPDRIDGAIADDGAALTEYLRAKIATLLDLRLLHVGINTPSADAAERVYGEFNDMLGLEKRDTKGSIFAGGCIEITKYDFLGEHGHIAFSTPDVDRALYYLENRGYTVNFDHVAKDEKGYKLAYLKGEYGGFAIHLTRR